MRWLDVLRPFLAALVLVLVALRLRGQFAALRASARAASIRAVEHGGRARAWIARLEFLRLGTAALAFIGAAGAGLGAVAQIPVRWITFLLITAGASAVLYLLSSIGAGLLGAWADRRSPR